MEIKISIEKKHLYYLTGLICLLLIGLVIATGYPTGEPFHQTLYTDTITGKSGTGVTVSDPLTVTGDLTTEKMITASDITYSGDLRGWGLSDEVRVEQVKGGDNKYDEIIGCIDNSFCFITYVRSDDV